MGSSTQESEEEREKREREEREIALSRGVSSAAEIGSSVIKTIAATTVAVGVALVGGSKALKGRDRNSHTRDDRYRSRADSGSESD